MEQKKIQRINELSQKAKSAVGLTEEEQTERQQLRQEYLRAVVGSLDHQLSQIVILDQDGKRHRLKKEEGGKP
jgi:uncharacterized protein YnzC (UPF0291/DUF896 family)